MHERAILPTRPDGGTGAWALRVSRANSLLAERAQTLAPVCNFAAKPSVGQHDSHSPAPPEAADRRKLWNVAVDIEDGAMANNASEICQVHQLRPAARKPSMRFFRSTVRPNGNHSLIDSRDVLGMNCFRAWSRPLASSISPASAQLAMSIR